MAATNAIGRKVAMGFAEEVNYNTPVAITNWLPVEPGADIKRSIQVIEANVIQQGRMARKDNIAMGITGCEVNIPMPAPVIGTDILLKHLFGKVVTTMYAEEYTHTFTVNPAGLFTGLTFGIHRDNHMLTASGVKLKSMALAAKVNDFLRMTVAGIGASVVDAAVTGTPSISNLATYPYWTFDKITATWNSIALPITGIDLTLTNELFDGEEASYAMGSQNRQLLRSGMFGVEGTIKRRFLNDNTAETQSKFWDVAEAITHYPLAITLDSGVIIESALTYKMTITIDEAHCEIPEVSTDAGLLMETIKFKGRFDGTTSGVTIETLNNSDIPVTATGSD